MRDLRAMLAAFAAPLALACSDLYTSCFRWAADGHCSTLRDFMHPNCASSCGLCEIAAVDPCMPERDAVGPGSIAVTFDRVASRETLDPLVLSRDPYVVVLDAFAGAEEAAELAEMAERIGFGARGSSCGFKPSGCNSASMSCIPTAGSACWDLQAMRRLEERMIEVLQVPAENCEPLRFFRYEVGETFRPHHDAAGQAIERDTPGGPRVWTLYLFLSDGVPARVIRPCVIRVRLS